MIVSLQRREKRAITPPTLLCQHQLPVHAGRTRGRYRVCNLVGHPLFAHSADGVKPNRDWIFGSRCGSKQEQLLDAWEAKSQAKTTKKFLRLDFRDHQVRSHQYHIGKKSSPLWLTLRRRYLLALLDTSRNPSLPWPPNIHFHPPHHRRQLLSAVLACLDRPWAMNGEAWHGAH